jgi:hypothetical protein
MFDVRLGQREREYRINCTHTYSFCPEYKRLQILVFTKKNERERDIGMIECLAQEKKETTARYTRYI